MERKILPILVLLGVFAVCSTREIPSPPRIVKQPPTDEVLFQVGDDQNDKPFFIECEAVGDPAPQYYWIKNGKNFTWQAYDDRMSQEEGRGTLSITKPHDVDIGQYQCFAQNKFGIATSNSVFMRKAELNSFKNTPPMTKTGQEGEPYKLDCQPPDGWPKPKVYWVIQYTTDGLKTINNSRLTVDPEGNLWFSNLTRQDTSENFYYACAAASNTKLEYKLGNRVLLNVVSSGVSASLNKHEPVQQYVTRKNEVALRGRNVGLYCIYGGTPLPQTVWTKDGREVHYSDRVTQNNYGKSLMIKLVDFTDEGTYTCEVSNGVGEAKSYSIKLQVLAIPYFTVEPEIRNAAEDETVEISCVASGVPRPEIKWIHNGRPIAEAPSNPRRKVGSNSIIIEGLTRNDTGNYGCNATNSLGYVYKDVYVNVLALAPEITEPPQDLEAVENKNIELICKVFGAPKPLVKWIHNGKELTGGRYSLQNDGNLLINSVQFDDSGEYYCSAENKFGKTHASARFTVRKATVITDGPEDYEVKAGTQANFKCNAKWDENLDIEILWQRDGKTIEFDHGSIDRFIKTSDHSLQITKTIELDSGVYTCVARTQLDEASAQATLIVQDVPNPPQMQGITCNKKDATIRWRPMGDNRAPISHYTIQYNTSFTPDSWEVAYDTVPAVDMSYNVPMSPWANYTFRIIAWNKIGHSDPSTQSDVCTTQPEVPHKNPENVIGEGDRPNDLVIKWTIMPEIEHNAPGFKYRVYYKRDISGEDYKVEDINDWKRNSFLVQDQPAFQQYRIKVIAMNELGEANVSPKEVIGYSGEDDGNSREDKKRRRFRKSIDNAGDEADSHQNTGKPVNPPTQQVPQVAPSNFTLVRIQSPTTALLSWNPVPLESVRGHFRGYKIKTWSARIMGHREIQVQGEATSALVTNFVPFSKNSAQVYVYNGKYNGPTSETLSFETPEGPPGPMSTLDAVTLGSTAFLLTWKPPDQPNGKLTGYKIEYNLVNGTIVSPAGLKITISDPTQLRTKIAELQPNQKYRIAISATTQAGESKPYFIERLTRGPGYIKPGEPKLHATRIQTDDEHFVNMRITWLPNMDKPGSHFYVKYKKKGETNPVITDSETVHDFMDIANLDPGELYEFQVVSVDGSSETVSEIQEVDTSPVGPTIQRGQNVATAGWFIGMMLAIAFLLLVLIIVCIVKRNRGGKYAVHEREQANGRSDYPDEGGFQEYSQPLDNKSHGRASMSSEPKLGPESDTDSMAEYGEGDTEGMNEDGSFIGQYGRQRKQGETTSQGFATLV